MITHRNLTQNRSTLIIVGLAAVLGLTALAVNFNGQGISPNPAAGGPAAGNASGRRAIEAYGARWAGLAASYASEQAIRAGAVQMQFLAGNTARSIEAYSGRSTGLAELPSRAVTAYAARWAGLAETYAPELAEAARWQGLAEAHQKRVAAQRQLAIEAYAARWTGLAETYVGK